VVSTTYRLCAFSSGNSDRIFVVNFFVSLRSEQTESLKNLSISKISKIKFRVLGSKTPTLLRSTHIARKATLLEVLLAARAVGHKQLRVGRLVALVLLKRCLLKRLTAPLNSSKGRPLACLIIRSLSETLVTWR
jgi:hypothetical protein